MNKACRSSSMILAPLNVYLYADEAANRGLGNQNAPAKKEEPSESTCFVLWINEV
jgi:hypothetical protein